MPLLIFQPVSVSAVFFSVMFRKEQGESENLFPARIEMIKSELQNKFENISSSIDDREVILLMTSWPWPKNADSNASTFPWAKDRKSTPGSS